MTWASMKDRMARPGKFGPGNVSADKARHTEPTIQAPDALPTASCRIPSAPCKGFLEFLLGVL